MEYASFTINVRFQELIKSVQNCSLCQRMDGRKKILSQRNGNIRSKLIFIAEAPGRLGADATEIPLYGDKTGDNFDTLLSYINWKREDVFITNAVLCNPREDNGNNATPTANEVKNCRKYLEMTIKLVDPEVIVTLGAIALKSLENISPHGLTLRKNVGKPALWNNKLLIPLYHTSPRAAVHRSLLKQRSDFINLVKLADPKRGIKRIPLSCQSHDKKSQ